jgi:hypothetical protein
MVGILHLRGKRLFLRTAGYTHLRLLCTQEHAKGSHVDGCCFAAAYGIRPWTPWIWGILNFRSIRVIESHIKGADDVGESKPTGRFEDN